MVSVAMLKSLEASRT